MAEDTKVSKETEYTKVKMTDGREVEFAGKQTMKKSAFEEAGELKARFDFLDGTTYTYTLPSALYQRFALHGALQKLGDAAAGCKKVEDAFEAVSTIGDRLKTEEDWAAKREGSGFAGASVVVRALMELKGRTREQVTTWMESKLASTAGLTRAKLYAQLRATEALKPIIQRLETEANKGNAKAGEDLLAEA